MQGGHVLTLRVQHSAAQHTRARTFNVAVYDAVIMEIPESLCCFPDRVSNPCFFERYFRGYGSTGTQAGLWVRRNAQEDEKRLWGRGQSLGCYCCVRARCQKRPLA